MDLKQQEQRVLSAPVMINLELTSGCNMKCRHCYNFWREDSASIMDRMSREKIDQMVRMVVEDKVFHVVLTGGEPFMNFDVLEYALREFTKAGVSTSVNSNLMIATPEKMRKLKDAGLDHVLTSLCSAVPETNDYMVNRKGAFKKIINGIETAIAEGIRISVNMIISDPNKDHVYDTAKLCSELGVQRIFGTRLVPSEIVENVDNTDFKLDKESALYVIDQLVKAEKDFGIGIGTLISYPLCLLGDLEKYKDFVGRGCPAQRGNRMVINANGKTHACTHESHSYGNVFEIGIKEAFRRMRKWHDGSYRYGECAQCDYRNICYSGCRSAAKSYFKEWKAKDPLFSGKENIKTSYKIEVFQDISQMIGRNEEFLVPQTVRFRKENGFYSINIRWANAYTIDSEIAEFLMEKQRSNTPISIKNMVGPDPVDELLKLIIKEAVIPQDERLRALVESGVKKGCSINPEDLPESVQKIIHT